MVGLLEHADRVVSRRFRRAGDTIVLLGVGRGELGGSEYLKLTGHIRGAPPALDLDAERALEELLVALATDRLIESAHDCSDGGFAVTLAECCFDTDGIGADVSIDPTAIADDDSIDMAAALFGESASRVIVSTRPEHAAAVLERATDGGVPAHVIGQTGGDTLQMAVGGRLAITVPLAEAEGAWASALEQWFAPRHGNLHDTDLVTEHRTAAVGARSAPARERSGV